MSTIRDIAVTALAVKPDYQPRINGLDEGHLVRLRQSDPAQWAPLLVRVNAQGGYDIEDGHHRYQVAQEQQLATVRCDIDDDVDYVPFMAAFEANAEHPLNLSLADRKQYACRLHTLYPDWSYRKLGRLAGISDMTVAKAIAYTMQQSSNDSVASPPTPLASCVTQVVGGKLWSYLRETPDAVAEITAIIASYDGATEQRKAAQSITVLGEILADAAAQFLD